MTETEIALMTSAATIGAALITGCIAIGIAVHASRSQSREHEKNREDEERRHQENLDRQQEHYELLIDSLTPQAGETEALQRPEDDGAEELDAIIEAVRGMYASGRRARSFPRIKARVPWIEDDRLREILGVKMRMTSYIGSESGDEFWRRPKQWP